MGSDDKMSVVKLDEKNKDILDSFLLDKEEVKPGKMFGYPAYYVGGKLFSSLYDEGVCLKVPESYADELLERDYIEPFKPKGTVMREWVLIIREKSEDYLEDEEIFNESIKFVSSIVKSSKKK